MLPAHCSLPRFLALGVGLMLAFTLATAQSDGQRDEPREVNEIPRDKRVDPLPWDGVLLEIAGKLTTDDPKDRVRKNSHAKVHTVKLEKDVVYQIDLISTQFDAFLRLEDAAGKQLEENDDGPVFPHSRIYFKPAKADSYRLVATTFKPGATGTYVLTVRPTEQKVLLGEDARRVAELQKQATQLFAAGRYGEAKKLAAQLLEIRERVQGANHWETITWRFRVHYCEIMGRLSAEDYASYLTVRKLDSEAVSLGRKGRHAEAEPLMQKLLAVYRKLLGDDDPMTAEIYKIIAINLNVQGKYADAGPIYHKALDISLRVLGEDHPDTAGIYNHVGMNLFRQGKYAEAEPLLRKGLDIRRRLLGENHLDTARSYNGVGANEALQKNYAEAGRFFQKGLEIRKLLLGESDPDTALGYGSVAGNLTEQGRHAEAGPLFEKALDIHRRTSGEDHPSTAISLDNVAGNLKAQGKYVEAAPLFQKAQEIFLRVLGADHPHTIICRSNLAANLHAQGKYADAEEAALAAVAGFEKVRLRIAFAGLERRSVHRPGPLLAALQARLEKTAEAAQQLESTLGRGLFDDLSSRQARPLGAQERLQEDDLAGQIEDLDRQIIALESRKDADGTLHKQSESLNQKRQALTIRLGELQTALAKKYGPAGGQVYDLARIQKHLPAGAALVAWLDRPDAPEQADPKGDHWAMLLRARGEPVWVQLAGTGTKGAWMKDDDELADEVRTLLAGQSEEKHSWQEKAALLARQRLDPLLKHLGATDDLPAVDKLIALPSPALRGIPLEALLAAAKDAPALTVSYAPSGTLFAWLKEQNAKPRKDDREVRILALGDPVFAKPEDKKPKDVALVRGPTFQPLPGTRREVEVIAKLFPDSTKFLGSDASEEKLDQLAADGKLKDFRYLHLATHGMIDAQSPMRSYLALAQDKLPDPLERVLAGKTPYTGELTAAHIMRTWKLDADLVVLSACQSGLGKYEGGEGYVGFSQALLLSGARSLVLSQWSVDDTATALLMVRFYENILGKREGLKRPMPKAQALQEAKSWLRNLTVKEAEKLVAQLPKVDRGKEREHPLAGPGVVRPFEHPYYWAAFILIGDPD